MKKVLVKARNKAKGLALRTGARIKYRSPEILLGVGVVSFVGTVVVACRQTLKCEDILDKHERAMLEIENCLELAKEEPDKVEYTLQDAKKDRFIAYCQTGLGFARVYAPAILLGVVSITSFGCSFKILKKRNLALTAAYTALDSAFKTYRNRVREELGEDSDNYFRYGYKKVKNAIVGEVDPETGELKAVEKEEIDVVPWDNTDGRDKTIFLFAPETSRYYGNSVLHNDMTIESVKNVAQVDYDMWGFMFLNDILNRLGLAQIPEGQLVGWCKGVGDDQIIFDVKKVHRPASTNPYKNPLGLKYECVYEISFNTCGVMYDKIDKINRGTR